MRIISGGQTGVDRAALDIAIARGLPYGGWCPRGGWAEDLPEPPGLLARYPRLQETPLADPAQRTERNVRDSDATLILVAAGGIAPSQGSALARELAKKYRTPWLVVDMEAPDALVRAAEWFQTRLAAWRSRPRQHLDEFALGIGGPRESEAPGIYGRARAFIDALLTGSPSDGA
jgi:Circularly permutated YpsA SLOG family